MAHDGDLPGRRWALRPIPWTRGRRDDAGMNAPDRLDQCAADLADAARNFHTAAGRPGSHVAAPDSLASLEDALQALSGAWYQLAADASPEILARRDGRGSRAGRPPRVNELSREQEARLMGALHDVAAAFARCARQCREGRTAAGPLIPRGAAAGSGGGRGHDSQLRWFGSREPPSQRVA
jgi:hypothetical protein